MIFKTVRKRQEGNHEVYRPLGPRAQFGKFWFEVSSDPRIEVIEVEKGPNDYYNAFPEHFAPLQIEILERTADTTDRAGYVCSVKVVVTCIKDDPVDSSIAAMTWLGRSWIEEVLPPLTEIIPPITNSLRTPTVVALSEACRQDHSFDRLPILADALEEAGCTDTLILEHCRLCTDHGSQCWVVDWVLDPVVLPIPRDRVAGWPERA
jgi:hypothetical protein